MCSRLYVSVEIAGNLMAVLHLLQLWALELEDAPRWRVAQVMGESLRQLQGLAFLDGGDPQAGP